MRELVSSLGRHRVRCALCGNGCGESRTEDGASMCGAGADADVCWSGVHRGEEPPISGIRGCGNVFFEHCSLACVYCQNWQISAGGAPFSMRMGPGQLAGEFLRLQEAGVDTLGLVSPTSHLLTVVPALVEARIKGLRIPVVYNTNGFESIEALRMLDGLVDIYLPDMKYASDETARVYSGITGYVSTNRAAVYEMFRQVGHLRIGSDGIAKRGLLIRHLILPGGISDTMEVLEWIAKRIGKDCHISLMSQYRPAFNVSNDMFPEINRELTPDEYEYYVALATELGFVNVFVQEPESSSIYNPDFARDRPFSDH